MSARPVIPLAAVLLWATPASADDRGSKGRIIRVTVNTTASENYTSFHGSIMVRQSQNGRRVEYAWGGTKCPGTSIAEGQVALLSLALDRRLTILPSYKKGQGSATRCLVGFELRRA